MCGNCLVYGYKGYQGVRLNIFRDDSKTTQNPKYELTYPISMLETIRDATSKSQTGMELQHIHVLECRPVIRNRQFNNNIYLDID